MNLEQGQRPLKLPYAQTNGEWLEMRPREHCLVRVSAKDTRGLYSLVEILSDPGDGTRMHIHAREDEHIAVLDGTAHIAYGDNVFDSHVGDVVILRKGIPDAWGNRWSTPLRIAVLAYGAVGERVEKTTALEPAIERALAAPGGGPFGFT